eukprot:1876951-Rhodomonas_salina.1
MDREPTADGAGAATAVPVDRGGEDAVRGEKRAVDQPPQPPHPAQALQHLCLGLRALRVSSSPRLWLCELVERLTVEGGEGGRFQHLYIYDYEGKLVRQLTDGRDACRERDRDSASERARGERGDSAVCRGIFGGLRCRGGSRGVDGGGGEGGGRGGGAAVLHGDEERLAGPPPLRRQPRGRRDPPGHTAQNARPFGSTGGGLGAVGSGGKRWGVLRRGKRQSF